MKTVESIRARNLPGRLISYKQRSIGGLAVSCTLAAIATLCAFYCSLVATSSSVSPSEMQTISRAIDLLEARGFDREAFLLRNTVSFRGTDNWINAAIGNENAYAATNFPFEIVTVYPDFYTKAVDDTERAMVLLHEAQHLQGGDETDAYAYVWKNRARLGWTQLSHGTTETYVTVGEQTREKVPGLFSCRSNLWNDCTLASKQ
jgi:hypothetical protein